MLVHCQIGVCRSASVVVAHLMWSRGCRSTVHSPTAQRRPQVQPRPEFVQQLRELPAFESVAHLAVLAAEEDPDVAGVYLQPASGDGTVAPAAAAAAADTAASTRHDV